MCDVRPFQAALIATRKELRELELQRDSQEVKEGRGHENE
jgi:hypothetical protein